MKLIVQEKNSSLFRNEVIFKSDNEKVKAIREHSWFFSWFFRTETVKTDDGHTHYLNKSELNEFCEPFNEVISPKHIGEERLRAVLLCRLNRKVDALVKKEQFQAAKHLIEQTATKPEKLLLEEVYLCSLARIVPLKASERGIQENLQGLKKLTEERVNPDYKEKERLFKSFKAPMNRH